MKLIKPSFEIWKSQGSLKDIERAARVCYQSQDKISEDDSSAITLVANLIKREHYAMLEFGKNINLSLDQIEILALFETLRRESLFKSLNFKEHCLNETIVSFNPRAALEAIIVIETKEDVKEESVFVQKLYNTLINELPSVIKGSRSIMSREVFFSTFIGTLDIIQPVTVNFICDRGVSHELVRHRHCSFAQKSTRFCDEKGDIGFIVPCWIPDTILDIQTGTPYTRFKDAVSDSEEYYKVLKVYGWKPEQARAVLPNALSTEIIVKANLQEWNHIFKLRCDKAAHPQMRELMIPLREEMKHLYPTLIE